MLSVFAGDCFPSTNSPLLLSVFDVACFPPTNSLWLSMSSWCILDCMSRQVCSSISPQSSLIMPPLKLHRFSILLCTVTQSSRSSWITIDHPFSNPLFFHFNAIYCAFWPCEVLNIYPSLSLSQDQWKNEETINQPSLACPSKVLQNLNTSVCERPNLRISPLPDGTSPMDHCNVGEVFVAVEEGDNRSNQIRPGLYP